jgi:hypothetical protein
MSNVSLARSEIDFPAFPCLAMSFVHSAGDELLLLGPEVVDRRISCPQSDQHIRRSAGDAGSWGTSHPDVVQPTG